MKNLYIILFFFFGINVNAQEFYITSYDYVTYINKIKYVDSNLNVTPLASFYFHGDQILDIAYAPTGKLYGVLRDAIIELDLQNGSSNVVYNFPVSGQFNSLVCNSNNEILVLEYYTQRLITIDLATFTEVSNVYLSESTTGDLTFYKGNLIFQSASTNNIISYDGNSLKTVACGLSAVSGDPILFWGLSNYTDSCESNFVYGFDPFGAVFSYDLESNTKEEVGQLREAYSWPVNGATSINEYTASACPLIKLDEVDCNLKIIDKELDNLLVYPNPVKDVLHIGNLNTQEEMFFTLYSLEGRKLTEGTLTAEIDFSKLSVGIYFIKIYNKSKTVSITKKIIKS